MEVGTDMELRTGKLIGYIFAIPSSIILAFSLYFSLQSPIVLLVSIIFALAASVGFSLILNPRLLIKLENNTLELYTGSLWANKKQIKISAQDIIHADILPYSDGESMSWFLYLDLENPPIIPDQAQRWIKASFSKKTRNEASDKSLMWPLTWPEGGNRGAKKKLNSIIH